MIAAIYARKSTEQNGVAEEARSVARQIEGAKMFAQSRGWTVSEAHIYDDDGISGAEFDKRPGYMKLMASAQPGAKFQALVMSDLDRLGRETFETGFALKQLKAAGIRVFTYLDKREVNLDSPLDAFMVQVSAFVANMERQKAQERTKDALDRKAGAGYVTGGRVFGYDNHPVFLTGVDGQRRRSHVEYVINNQQADVVRRVFALAAEGLGFTAISKTLNQEGEASPRAQRGRSDGWASSSVREVLNRTIYRGEITYNQTKKRDAFGKKKQTPRPESEWMKTLVPHLRILSDELWDAAHQQLAKNRSRYGKDGAKGGRPPGEGGKYLLTSIGKCGVCGGGMEAQSRKHGKGRKVFFQCSTHYRKGAVICGNDLVVPQESAERAVLDGVVANLLDAQAISELLEAAYRRLVHPSDNKRQQSVTRDLKKVETKLAYLASAVEEGGEIAILVQRMKEQQGEKARLVAELERLTAARKAVPSDPATIHRKLESMVADWRGCLLKRPTEARDRLKALVVDRIIFTPRKDEGGRFYELSGVGTVEPVIRGLAPQNLASPTGFEPVS